MHGHGGTMDIEVFTGSLFGRRKYDPYDIIFPFPTN